MSHRYCRGSVVACRRAIGVVWACVEDELVVLPIGRSDGMRYRCKVAIDQLSDLIAAGLSARDLVIHADMPTRVPAEGQRQLGTLPGRLQCEVSRAVTRASVHQHFAARWAGEREARMRRLESLRTAV